MCERTRSFIYPSSINKARLRLRILSNSPEHGVTMFDIFPISCYLTIQPTWFGLMHVNAWRPSRKLKVCICASYLLYFRNQIFLFCLASPMSSFVVPIHPNYTHFVSLPSCHNMLVLPTLVCSVRETTECYIRVSPSRIAH